MKRQTISARTISKLVISLSLILCLPSIAFAQKDKQDVVYLKNGSVVRGEIVVNEAAQIKLQTADNNLWSFQRTEIDSIRKEPTLRPTGYLSKSKGYYNASMVGITLPSIYGDAGISLSMSNGYKFSRYFGIGGVVELNTFKGDIFIPISLEARGELLANSITPFWFGQIGWPALQDLNHDLPFNPGRSLSFGGGMQFMIGQNTAFLVELGMKMQQATYQEDWWWWGGGIRTEKVDYRRTSLKVGLLF